MRTVVVTEEHLKILRRLNFMLDEDALYDPVPTVDSKRPLGNSDGAWRDVAKILGWEQLEDDDGEKHWPKGTRAKAQALFDDMTAVLTACVGAASFRPGRYSADDYRDNWRWAVCEERLEGCEVE